MERSGEAARDTVGAPAEGEAVTSTKTLTLGSALTGKSSPTYALALSYSSVTNYNKYEVLRPSNVRK